MSVRDYKRLGEKSAISSHTEAVKFATKRLADQATFIRQLTQQIHQRSHEPMHQTISKLSKDNEKRADMTAREKTEKLELPARMQGFEGDSAPTRGKRQDNDESNRFGTMVRRVSGAVNLETRVDPAEDDLENSPSAQLENSPSFASQSASMQHQLDKVLSDVRDNNRETS